MYTDLNYSRHNGGRTWQQDARTLVPKRMSDGSIKNLIYVWEGEEDRWTATEAEIADIERRDNVTNSATASDAEMLEAFNNAAPALRPDAFQAGMEDADIQGPPPGAVPPTVPTPVPAVPNVNPVPSITPASVHGTGTSTPGNPAAPNNTDVTKWTTQGVVCVGSTTTVTGALKYQVDICLPGKRKRQTTYDSKDLDTALNIEHKDYHDVTSTIRETFFHSKLEALITEMRVNHESMLKPANSQRRMDEVIQLRDQIDILGKIKATVQEHDLKFSMQTSRSSNPELLELLPQAAPTCSRTLAANDIGRVSGLDEHVLKRPNTNVGKPWPLSRTARDGSIVSVTTGLMCSCMR